MQLPPGARCHVSFAKTCSARSPAGTADRCPAGCRSHADTDSRRKTTADRERRAAEIGGEVAVTGTLVPLSIAGDLAAAAAQAGSQGGRAGRSTTHRRETVRCPAGVITLITAPWALPNSADAPTGCTCTSWMKSTPGSERAMPLHGHVKLVPSNRNWFSFVPEPNAETVVMCRSKATSGHAGGGPDRIEHAGSPHRDRWEDPRGRNGCRSRWLERRSGSPRPQPRAIRPGRPVATPTSFDGGAGANAQVFFMKRRRSPAT